jgi:hypothetical protein
MITSTEFVKWFRGFVDGAHDFTVTPKQWDLIKEKLKEVDDTGILTDSNTFKVSDFPNYYNLPNWFNFPTTSTNKIIGEGEE